MITPTVSEIFRIFNLSWWEFVIMFIVYGLHDYLIYFLSSFTTRRHMLAHEMPYLYDANMERLIKERNKIRAENKALRAKIKDFEVMRERAKSVLGVKEEVEGGER